MTLGTWRRNPRRMFAHSDTTRAQPTALRSQVPCMHVQYRQNRCRRCLTSEVRAQRQTSSCVIYGGWSGRAIGLFPSFFGIPLSVLLHNCSISQRLYALFVKLTLLLTNAVLTKGCSVSLFPRTPLILPKVFHCFPQSLEATSGTVLTSHCPILSHTLLLLVPIIRHYTTIWLRMRFFLPRLNRDNQLGLEILKGKDVINSFLTKHITSFVSQTATKLPKCDTHFWVLLDLR